MVLIHPKAGGPSPSSDSRAKGNQVEEEVSEVSSRDSADPVTRQRVANRQHNGSRQFRGNAEAWRGRPPGRLPSREDTLMSKYASQFL